MAIVYKCDECLEECPDGKRVSITVVVFIGASVAPKEICLCYKCYNEHKEKIK